MANLSSYLTIEIDRLKLPAGFQSRQMIRGDDIVVVQIPTRLEFPHFYISTPRKRILIIPFAHTHHFYRAIVQYKIWSYCVCRDSTVTVYDIPSMHVRIKPVPMEHSCCPALCAMYGWPSLSTDCRSGMLFRFQLIDRGRQTMRWSLGPFLGRPSWYVAT